MLSGRDLSGQRVAHPENPGRFVTKCAGGDVLIPNVERTLAVWANPKQIQEQINRRLCEISSMVDPVKARSGTSWVSSRRKKCWSSLSVSPQRNQEYSNPGQPCFFNKTER
jgi:hypothetical protein